MYSQDEQKMRVSKALITAASPSQRSIPLQNLVAQDRSSKPALAFLCEEIAAAGIEEIACVVHPGDEERYADILAPYNNRIRFIPQTNFLNVGGYAAAILSGRDFLAGEPFLHLVGDHLYINRPGGNCTRALLDLAQAEECSVSLVQPGRETQLAYFGCAGGRRVTGKPGVYRVENVIEKPTPTEAEQKLLVPGLRAGHYLCFFGMHVLTPGILPALEHSANLSAALAELSRHEQYLALECNERRFDIGSRYGLMYAQMALALSGRDRDEVLVHMLEMFAGNAL